MSIYQDYDVKARSMTKFLRIIEANNHSLGKRLSEYREAIFFTAIQNIQQIGVTSYAAEVLGRKSTKRLELERAIEREG